MTNASLIRNLPHSKHAPVAFSLDSQALNHIMSVLSNMYSEPNLAVIRELATNARDSHSLLIHQSGSQLPAISITLPDASQPFIIRDFGTGMDFHDVLNIFGQYGNSTKRSADNNLFTGQLGIGCKSPFAISSSFAISSFFAGFRHDFFLVLNENQIGEINHTHSTPIPPEEFQSGFQVSVPVSGNQYEFCNAFAQFIRYFPEPISIQNPEVLTNKKIILSSIQPESNLPKPEIFRIESTNKTFILETYKFSSNNVRIIMGGVMYPVNTALLSSEARNNIPGVLNILAPLNSVSFAPSRETLIYDKKTVEFINDAIILSHQECLKILLSFSQSINLESINSFINFSRFFRNSTVPQRFQNCINTLFPRDRICIQYISPQLNKKKKIQYMYSTSLSDLINPDTNIIFSDADFLSSLPTRVFRGFAEHNSKFKNNKNITLLNSNQIQKSIEDSEFNKQDLIDFFQVLKESSSTTQEILEYAKLAPAAIKKPREAKEKLPSDVFHLVSFPTEPNEMRRASFLSASKRKVLFGDVSGISIIIDSNNPYFGFSSAEKMKSFCVFLKCIGVSVLAAPGTKHKNNLSEFLNSKTLSDMVNQNQILNNFTRIQTLKRLNSNLFYLFKKNSNMFVFLSPDFQEYFKVSENFQEDILTHMRILNEIQLRTHSALRWEDCFSAEVLEHLVLMTGGYAPPTPMQVKVFKKIVEWFPHSSHLSIGYTKA